NGISVYSIPVYTGTMRITNSRGTIYIDQQPVSITGLPLSMLSDNTSSSMGADMFDGSIYSNMSLPTYNSITLVFYFLNNTRTSNCAGAFSLNFADSWSLHGYVPQCYVPWGPGSMTLYLFNPSDANVGQSAVPNTTSWEQIAVILNASNNTFTAYQNGKHIFTMTPSNTMLPMSPSSIDLLKGPFEFSNVQLYGAALSSKQITQLYKKGISASPFQNENLSIWLPLNGNTKDYSGYGNAASISGTISYDPVSEISTKLIAGDSPAVNSVPIGAVSSLGAMDVHLSNGHYVSDANGTVRMFLTSNSSSGIANITINGFNGNLSTVGNLVAWFPLDLGYGNTIYSMVNNLTGTFVNPSWEPMPGNSSSMFAGTFDGSNSIVNTTFSAPHAASGITISAWINNNGKGSYWQNIAEVSGEPYTHETLDIGVTGSGGNAVIRWGNYANTFTDQPGGGVVNPNTWYLITGVWSGFNNTLSVYINGNLVATGNGNDTGLTSIREINIGGAYPGMFPFNGSMANVQVYNSSLSQAQIQQLYKEGISSTPIGSAGLQAWYPLDGNANDYSVYKHVATIKNVSFASSSFSTPVSTNPSYRVANFSGQSGSSYIITPILTGLNGAVGASFNACFYLNSLLTNEILFSDDWSSSQVMQIYIHTNGQLEADYGNGGWFSVALTPTNTITTGKRYCITTTYASGSGQEIYVNGASQPLTYSIGSSTSTGTLTSGTTGDIAYNQGNGGAFAGQIADVQIYNITLTKTQISQLYTQGLPFFKKINVSV
ncbi:MAG: LamG domain-containing protein, partial [Candidatus Micrarchaeaceae archaeon]